MTDPRELDPILPAEERDELGRLIRRLETERPVPNPTFRGQLRRSLLGTADRPKRRAGSTATAFRLWAAGYAAAGTLCLAVAAIGLIGVGPFAS